MNLFTTRIIASVTGTIVLALCGSLFYVAGQNSELHNELSRIRDELTTVKKQNTTLTQTTDQAIDQIIEFRRQEDSSLLKAVKKCSCDTPIATAIKNPALKKPEGQGETQDPSPPTDPTDYR